MDAHQTQRKKVLPGITSSYLIALYTEMIMMEIDNIHGFKIGGTGDSSEETGTGCPVTSKYEMTPPNKHGGVGQQQYAHLIYRIINCLLIWCCLIQGHNKHWCDLYGRQNILLITLFSLI